LRAAASVVVIDRSRRRIDGFHAGMLLLLAIVIIISRQIIIGNSPWQRRAVLVADHVRAAPSFVVVVRFAYRPAAGLDEARKEKNRST
jgi:hypothetical protein